MDTISGRFRNFTRGCAIVCAGIAGIAGLNGLTSAGALSPRCDAILVLINQATDPAVKAALQGQFNAACTTPTTSAPTTSLSTTSSSSTSSTSTSAPSTTSTTLSPAQCQELSRRIAAATDPALIAQLQAYFVSAGCNPSSTSTTSSTSTSSTSSTSSSSTSSTSSTSTSSTTTTTAPNSPCAVVAYQIAHTTDPAALARLQALYNSLGCNNP